MMISVEEARKLSEQNDTHFNHLIDTIGTAIKNAAEKGERVYYCYISGLWESKPAYPTVVRTDLQHKVILKIRSYGYEVELKAHGDRYVPRGLEAEDGSGPKYVNHVIEVKW